MMLKAPVYRSSRWLAAVRSLSAVFCVDDMAYRRHIAMKVKAWPVKWMTV